MRWRAAVGELDSATLSTVRTRLGGLEEAGPVGSGGRLLVDRRLYVKVGIEDRKSALLTIVDALTTGEKIMLACESGEPESKESWLMILRNFKHRGLTFPQLTVADGHLGIWAAFGEIHPTWEEQRCWNHKITNVLNDLPKKAQQKAAELLKAMPHAETNADCERRPDAFVRTYRQTDKKAVETLLRDWDRMVTFYSFPREH